MYYCRHGMAGPWQCPRPAGAKPALVFDVIVHSKVKNNLPELALVFGVAQPERSSRVGSGEPSASPHAEQELNL